MVLQRSFLFSKISCRGEQWSPACRHRRQVTRISHPLGEKLASIGSPRSLQTNNSTSVPPSSRKLLYFQLSFRHRSYYNVR